MGDGIDSGYLQTNFHVLVDLHYRCTVAASVAVVWCGEHSDNVLVVRPVVSVHHKLMGTCDPGQAIGVVKLLRYVLAERVSSTTGRDTPTASIIGVGPEQIANWALMGNLLHAV